MLSVLTVITDPGEDAWRAQFELQRACPRTYYSIVIVDKASDRIVAVGTLFLERKFLRGLGMVGHIEDIAVDKSQQGKKLGLRVIQALTGISENSGCYKTILNCSDSNVREYYWPSVPHTLHVLLNASGSLRRLTSWLPAFYQKCGYQKKENEMVSSLNSVKTHSLTPPSGEVCAGRACPDTSFIDISR